MRNEIILRAEPQRAFAIDFLSKLKLDEAKPYVMTVELHKKKRTLSQLALLWVRHAEVSKAVAEYTGYSPEDVHELLKQKFLKPTIIQVGDEVVRRYTTKGLTVAEMTEFMAQIEAWASSDLGLILADPQDRMAR